MNKRPVERALATLLPTHENELPSELLTLAHSLIAQSRSYSSSLKPEEEIARPYACAEIACRRLSRTLKLPPLLGHPPCPPRVYKKLYTFLDKSIGGGSATSKNKSNPPTPNKASSTPRKADTNASPSQTPSKQSTQHGTPSKGTPLGKRALDDEASMTPSRTASVKRARFMQEPVQSTQNFKDAPQFVMPSIRAVCKILSTPAPRMTLWSRPPISRTLPPHIFAGVSSILHFISSMTKEEMSDLDEETVDFMNVLRMPEEKDTDDYKEVVMALIVAVYFLVLARRRSPGPNAVVNPPSSTSASASPGPSMSPSSAGDSRKMDKKTFSEMRQTALSSLELPPAEKRHGEDVDTWIALIMSQKWAKGQEWFENIPLAGDREDELEDELDNDDGSEHDARNVKGSKRRKTNIFLHAGKDEEGLLLPGLGTMMQDRVNYLSEDRREDYLEWKADFLGRIGKTKKIASSRVNEKKVPV